MRLVAFYRNVNLGQPRSPTRPQLETALAQAGAANVASFQTNGTVVFSAADESAATDMVAAASVTLARVCDLREPAFVVPLEHLVELVAAEPFAGRELAGGYEYAATFSAPGAFAALPVPLNSSRGDVEVVRVTQYAALSVSRQVMASFGSPTVLFEKALGTRVTTRGWPTIIRLVKKHG